MSEDCDPQTTYVVAMQKVVGSNPISRFFANALHVGGSRPRGRPEPTGTTPAYRLHFRNQFEMVPEPARIRGD